ncbi:MAG TPA: DUF6607 family protein [Candidatus Binatia bacterium]|nr:DUF6607 family protein [Candidatus Binatia bacterium]
MDRRGARRALALTVVAAVVGMGGSSGRAEESPRARGVSAITNMAGCYLVDYSYTEVESLRPGYVRDARVYDVNRDKSVKEWIQADAISPGRIRLDRVLFATDLAGAVRPGSVIRHQAEDWEYDAPFLYDFAAPSRWTVKDLRATPGLWTRRITNLDDGLRYQCAARWAADTAYPEWSCSNYAPIPGRETRDMGRADYDALERGTRIVIYGRSWLERQDNVKTSDGDGGRRPLARELGKNWYVRLPDAECAEGQAFARARQPFWTLLRETWDGVLRGESPFVETVPAGQPPRFVKMWEVEQDYLGQDLTDPAVRSAARARILEVIEAYRVR